MGQRLRGWSQEMNLGLEEGIIQRPNFYSDLLELPDCTHIRLRNSNHRLDPVDLEDLGNGLRHHLVDHHSYFTIKLTDNPGDGSGNPAAGKCKLGVFHCRLGLI